MLSLSFWYPCQESCLVGNTNPATGSYRLCHGEQKLRNDWRRPDWSTSHSSGNHEVGRRGKVNVIEPWIQVAHIWTWVWDALISS